MSWFEEYYDARKAYQKDLIMKVLETSTRSLDEILQYINEPKESAADQEF